MFRDPAMTRNHGQGVTRERNGYFSALQRLRVGDSAALQRTTVSQKHIKTIFKRMHLLHQCIYNNLRERDIHVKHNEITSKSSNDDSRIGQMCERDCTVRLLHNSDLKADALQGVARRLTFTN